VRVRFTKKERRYDVYVERDRATDLFITPAPGYHDWLPHDLLHFVAEAEFGLDGGVFGDLAAGGNARIFIPVDKTQVAKLWRANRVKKVKLPEGRRSEELAGELERGWRTRELDATLLAKLDALAERWHARRSAASSRSSGRDPSAGGANRVRGYTAAAHGSGAKPSRLELLLSPTYLPS
jgi:hypothetical protein